MSTRAFDPMNQQPDPSEHAARQRRRTGAGPMQTMRAVVALCGCIAATPAAAERDEGGSTADDWSFSVAPYFWAAGIEGTTGTLPGLPPAKVDMRFADIFDDLQPSGMVFFTASKGRLGFAADLQYVETEAKSHALAPLFGQERLRSTSVVASALVNYLVLDDGRLSMRLGGGARLWSVATDVKLSGGLLPARRRSSDETWVDPIIGGGGVFALSPKVSARGWAYIGGFGVASNLTADLFAGLDYRFTDSISATMGYRWVKVDYDKDDFLYDVRQQGIATGVIFAF